MATDRRKIVHLLVTIKGIQYVLGTLRFNYDELSCFFHYPINSLDLHLNYETGKLTHRLDHITWHNGKIHIKRKDNVAIETIEYPGLLLSKPPRLTPIFVESCYLTNSPVFIEVKNFPLWQGSLSREILSLDSSEGFSWIILLVPSQNFSPDVLMRFQFATTPEGLLYPPCLGDLSNHNHRPICLKVWENWEVVIVPTPFVQRISSQVPITGSYRLPNFKNAKSGLTDLMLQASRYQKIQK